MYNKLIRVRADSVIMSSGTDGMFRKPDDMIITGQTDDRHWSEMLVNEDSILCKKWDGSEIIDRPQTDIDADKSAIDKIKFFESSDKSFMRVFEETLALLISKNVLKKTDLSPEAQVKYDTRKKKR